PRWRAWAPQSKAHFPTGLGGPSQPACMEKVRHLLPGHPEQASIKSPTTACLGHPVSKTHLPTGKVGPRMPPPCKASTMACLSAGR
ncbi:unnamed protein product, partial [Penicillium egyptiacum]